MEDITESFEKLGVVPVVVLEDAKDAVPLATALVDGGLERELCLLLNRLMPLFRQGQNLL